MKARHSPFAKAYEHCFYGEVSTDVLDLEHYVANELSFIAPNGAINVRAPYSEVRRCLALRDASGASYCYRDLIFVWQKDRAGRRRSQL